MQHISPDSPATTNVESHDGTAFSRPNSSTLSNSVSLESNNQGNSAVRVSDFLTWSIMHIFIQEMLDFANLLHALQMVEQESKPTTKQQAIYQETRKALRPDGNNTSFLPLIIIIIIIIIVVVIFILLQLLLSKR